MFRKSLRWSLTCFLVISNLLWGCWENARTSCFQVLNFFNCICLFDVVCTSYVHFSFPICYHFTVGVQEKCSSYLSPRIYFCGHYLCVICFCLMRRFRIFCFHTTRPRVTVNFLGGRVVQGQQGILS